MGNKGIIFQALKSPESMLTGAREAETKSYVLVKHKVKASLENLCCWEGPSGRGAKKGTSVTMKLMSTEDYLGCVLRGRFLILSKFRVCLVKFKKYLLSLVCHSVLENE